MLELWFEIAFEIATLIRFKKIIKTIQRVSLIIFFDCVKYATHNNVLGPIIESNMSYFIKHY